MLNTSVCIDITYHVKEGQNPNTLVGNIASDAHLYNSFNAEDLNRITFSRLHESLSGNAPMFKVGKNGMMYTSQTLDAESLCKYNTECFKIVEVAVRHKESFVKVIEVKVIIDDVNDHQPEFISKDVYIQFYETDSSGTTKSIPNAIDNDVGFLNSQITYQLKKDINDPFTLSVIKKIDGTRKLRIVLEKKLDREINSTYTLQVIAKDGGSPSHQGILTIHVSVTDENDNQPVFSKNVYNVSINNRQDIYTPIVTVYATDLDSGENGKVSYYFSSKTSDFAKTLFYLNETSGKIFLARNFPSIKRKTFKLFIDAIDKGSPPLSSTAMVLVNIINRENNAPILDVKFVSEPIGNITTISEGVKTNSFIAYVKVSDNDVNQNGEVVCDLNHDKLQLQKLGRKKYKVVLKNPVDRESESYIDFMISCQDKGSPPLRTERKFNIQVTDVNDVQPQFTKDTFKFLTYENEKSNFPVGFINASDPDLGAGGQLSYFLLSKGIHNLPFEISNFGFISTSESLDREQRDVYKFQVLIRDNGIPSLNNTANIIVEVMDKNDNAPYFTFPSVNPFSLDVHYQPQSNNEVTVLRASDRDSHVNAFLKYEIEGGNNKQLFTINPYTGVISYSRTVYQNDAGSYDLQLIVKDSGTPVLSAKTILSVALTVSNTTSKMFTSVDIKSDHKIHINLVVIIVVAAVIISVAIVISMAVCMIHKNNQRNSRFNGGLNNPNKLFDERIQYDVPVAMVTEHGNSRHSQANLLKREPESEYKSVHSLKGLSSVKHTYTMAQRSHQEAAVTSGVSKEHELMLIPTDHFNKISTMSSDSDSGHGWSERNTVHYETLPGFKHCQEDQQQHKSRSSLPWTTHKPKDISTKPSCQAIVDQKIVCNDVIDLKSLRIKTANLPEPWNLPIKNSFSSFPKPLPSVPKVPKP
ncbi:putative protocadherin beta-18 [Octopus vulgaris]|uniref:Protocadherin beta-18 n=2 Tax=Octopus TaxID=6643 RepID=A0AA36BDI5_OCTVU|nr:putative protocadherin beta-18 [Octopus vulgaris]